MLRWLPEAASDSFPRLDLLRFLASVGIVVHHSLEYPFEPERRAAIHDQTMGLALFVDLFFLISGFVIAYAYAHRMNSLQDALGFMRRRIARLVPLHWLTMAAMMAVLVPLILAGAPINHPPSLAPECIMATAILVQAWFPCGNGMYFNGVNWSISAEMGMHLLFPVLMLAPLRVKRAYLGGGW